MRYSRLVLVGLALSFALAQAAFTQAAGVTEIKLDNGLTVLVKEVHAAPVFTAQVWFKVGSRNEHTGITGVSHLLEHMLFNASKNFKTGEITKMVRERGGIDNAATWTDFTYYWELLSSDHLDFALMTLAEKVQNALLLPDEFDKERTVVLSEREGHENDPDRVLYEALMATAFEAHPYQWPVIGWKSDIAGVSREQMQDYYRRYYHPGNATLVLVGDFEPEKALELVRKHFGSIPGGPDPGKPHTVEPAQRGERKVAVRMQGSAARVIIGYHVPGLEDPDTYPLIVLDQILSGGRSSRMYQALVETQLATGAWSSAGARKEPSLFMLGATARPGVSAEKLEAELLRQVEIANKTLPSVQEMQGARNQLEAYFIFQNDSVSDQGEQLGYYNTVAASWKYLDGLVDRIKAVEPREVRAVARKYLTRENLTVAKFLPANAGARPIATPGGPGGGPIRRDPTPALPDAGTGQVRPTRVVLDNGLVVIVQENHANPTVALSCILKAGSCFDPEGRSGTAALTADMVSRGTRKRSALEIAQQIEFVGAQLGGAAEVESVRFSGKTLSKDFPLLLDLLSDELRNAIFPKDQFEKAKGEVLSGLEQSMESPDAVAFRRFYNAVYPPGHAYHQLTVEAARKELSAITREDLVAFHKTYYRPDTTILTIVGDVDTAKAMETVKQHLGGWKAQGPQPKVDIPTINPQKEARRIFVPMADKSESTVVFGCANTIRRADPDYYAFRIMNQILGGAGALASILGEEIREKQGLAYDVYSTFDVGLGAGPWYAALGTNPKNVDKAVQTLKAQIARFKNSGATQEQFERAREFIVGVFPIALETNSGVAGALISAEFYGLGMDYLRNYAAIYRAVTLDKVNAAASKYLHPDTATLVIAGPTADN